jgi:hypothetical protein
MKRFLLLSALFFPLISVSGQGYKQAAGIRASWHAPGIEYRFYPSDMNSYKVLLATRDHGLQLYGFAEFYQYDLFPFTHQLILLYGLGAHAGYESWDVVRSNGNGSYYDSRSSFLAGLDALAGLEYVFYEVPLMAGIEIKPYFDVFGRRGFDIDIFDIALTVKYLF